MELRTIETYDNAADLIREHCQEDVSDDILDYLRHIDDFEAIGFLVINGSDVITFDTINGHAYYQMPLDEFIKTAISAAWEEVSDEN